MKRAAVGASRLSAWRLMAPRRFASRLGVACLVSCGHAADAPSDAGPVGAASGAPPAVSSAPVVIAPPSAAPIASSAPAAVSSPLLEGLVHPKPKELPPLKELPIALGKGAGNVVLGTWLVDVERELGPCSQGIHMPPAKTCAYPAWGIDVGLESGQVARVSLYRAGREIFGSHVRSKGFRGKSPEGIALGMKGDDAVAKLGEPTQKLAPGSGPASDLWLWKKQGVGIELENGIVAAIHIPRAAGRPK